MPNTIVSLAMVVMVLGGFWEKARAQEIAINEPESQLYLAADSLTHHAEEEIFIAQGNVEMAYEGYVLTADKVLFSEDRELARVEGHVRLLTPQGTIIYSDSAVLDDQLKNGIINNLRMILKEGRFAARRGIRVDGVENHLSQAVYSSCRPCEDGGPLPWQIKASTIIHDEEAHDIVYHHALLEIYGIPTIYLPYYVTPDPTVKRRSGLLRPILDYSSLLGGVTALPLYIAYSAYGDITLTPGYASREGPIMLMQGQHNFSHSTISFEASGAYDDKDGEHKKSRWMGHVSSDSLFVPHDDWRIGWNANFLSHRTYLKRYDILTDIRDAQELRSEFFVDYQGRDHQFSMSNLYFQDLRPDRDEKSPAILPRLKWDYLPSSNDDIQRFRMGGDIVNVRGSDDDFMQRLIFNMSWEGLLDWRGLHLTGEMEMRSDFYNYKNFSARNYRRGRFIPSASLDGRYPLYARHESDWVVIEPRVFLTSLPNNVANDAILNQDSQNFFFQSNQLFAPMRLAGFDQIEGGTRIDYGVDIHFGRADGESLLFRLGQSYRLHRDTSLPQSIRTHKSDWAGALEWRWQENKGVKYQFNVKGEKKAGSLFSYHGLGIVWQEFNTTFYSQYSYLDAERSHEWEGRMTWAISDGWHIGAHGRYNLAEGHAIRSGVSLRYARDCINLSLAFDREFISDSDASAHNKVSLKLNFVGLGGDEF